EATAQEQNLRTLLVQARQKVEERKTLMQNAKSRGNLYRALMQQKEKGTIDGICGRLGDLGIIDPKYDIAISTACGALDNIVVTTVTAGQKCIEYLKKHGLGRATFLCLDKIREWDTAVPSTPENCPRLFDLVKVREERFKNVFYQVLQNTLVATDLKQGERVAFGTGVGKRWRVVTLNGQLIESSGAMSGGGGAPVKGGMGNKFLALSSNVSVAGSLKNSSSNDDDVNLPNLEKERENAEQQLAGIVAERKTAEKKVEQAELEFPKITLALDMLDVDLKAGVASISEAEKILSEAMKNNRSPPSDEARKAELMKIIQKHKSQIDSYNTKHTVSIERAIKDLQNKILEAGGIQFRSQQAIVDEVIEQIETNRERANKMQVERSTRAKAAEKEKKSVDKSQDELAKVEEDKTSVEDDLTQIREAAKEVRKKVAEGHKFRDEKIKYVKNLQKSIDEQQTTINLVRMAEVEISNELSDLKALVNECKHQLKNIERQLNDAKLIETGFEEEPLESLQNYSEEELAGLNEQMIRSELGRLNG
ncbi:hypothetical protein HK096_006778, partial [Nowakowskiella sp. JEL0078]